MRLSTGAIGVVLTLYIFGLFEAILLAFIYAGRDVAIIAYGVGMPLIIVGMYGFPWSWARNFCRMIAIQFATLLPMTLPPAFFFRLGYEVSWDFGLGPISNVLFTMALWGMGIISPLVLMAAGFKAPSTLKTVSASAAGGAMGAGAAARSRIRKARGKGDEDDAKRSSDSTSQSRDRKPNTRTGERLQAVRRQTRTGNGSHVAAEGSSRRTSSSRPASTSGGSSSGGSRSAKKIRELAQSRRAGSGPTANKARYRQSQSSSSNSR
jgi:hypothetical protein